MKNILQTHIKVEYELLNSVTKVNCIYVCVCVCVCVLVIYMVKHAKALLKGDANIPVVQ